MVCVGVLLLGVSGCGGSDGGGAQAGDAPSSTTPAVATPEPEPSVQPVSRTCANALSLQMAQLKDGWAYVVQTDAAPAAVSSLGSTLDMTATLVGDACPGSAEAAAFTSAVEGLSQGGDAAGAAAAGDAWLVAVGAQPTFG